MFPADDTIVALSTAAGAAPRAIVRLSGPDAIALGESVLVRVPGSAGQGPWRDRLDEVGGFRHVPACVALPEADASLPGRVYVFRAPRSYTRQDVVELHVPGCPAVTTALVEALVEAGARRAGPGEFTARAFFGGRIDLSQAEAVADVIDAADAAQARAAAGALRGRLHDLCSAAADEVADVLASVEASIDLAEEHIELDVPRRLAARLGRQERKLRQALAEAADMPETADRPRVVLAGRPNAGKSSLLNALSGVDRAIVSAMAGTTRDVLSAAGRISEQAVVFQDAAGFAADSDTLGIAAGAAARRAVASADVVVLVEDATRGPGDTVPHDAAFLDELRATNPRAPLLVVINKIDLLDSAASLSARPGDTGGAGVRVLRTSATRGDGLDALRGALTEVLGLAAGRSGAGLGLHQRQRECLRAAADAMRRSRGLLVPSRPAPGAATARAVGEVADVAELVAVELRAALAALAGVSGEVTTEDILGRIFARFCVGK
ncbi:MAG: tRNA modification GTPase [Planctomycetota bacterium]